MKVKANHWINVDGVWHPAGEVFEVSKAVEGVEVLEKSTPKAVNEPVETELKTIKRNGHRKTTSV